MRSAKAPTKAAPEAVSATVKRAPACWEPTWLVSSARSGSRTTASPGATWVISRPRCPAKGTACVIPCAIASKSVTGAGAYLSGDAVYLEQVRAQLLVGHAGDNRDQVSRFSDSLQHGQRRAIVEQAAHLGVVLAEDRADAEEQIEPAHRLGAGRDRQYRHVGAVGGDEAGRAAARRRHDHRRQAKSIDRANRALGDRVGDVLGRLLGAGEEPLAIGQVGLGRA